VRQPEPTPKFSILDIFTKIISPKDEIKIIKPYVTESMKDLMDHMLSAKIN
jgi:hypothetical protein